MNVITWIYAVFMALLVMLAIMIVGIKCQLDIVVREINFENINIKIMNVSYELVSDRLLVNISLSIVRPNPCYRVTVIGITEEEGRIIINTLVEPPKPGSFCIQVIPPPQEKSIGFETALVPPTSINIAIRVINSKSIYEETIAVFRCR